MQFIFLWQATRQWEEYVAGGHVEYRSPTTAITITRSFQCASSASCTAILSLPSSFCEHVIRPHLDFLNTKSVHLARTVSLSYIHTITHFSHTPFHKSTIDRYCGMHSQIPACLKSDRYMFRFTRHVIYSRTDWRNPCTVSREKRMERTAPKCWKYCINITCTDLATEESSP
jgi:hypothetical protein